MTRTTPELRFDGVWKSFRRGQNHDSLRDLIPSLARRVMRRPRTEAEQRKTFWALRDFSFDGIRHIVVAVGTRSGTIARRYRGPLFGFASRNGANAQSACPTRTRLLSFDPRNSMIPRLGLVQ